MSVPSSTRWAWGIWGRAFRENCCMSAFRLVPAQSAASFLAAQMIFTHQTGHLPKFSLSSFLHFLKMKTLKERLSDILDSIQCRCKSSRQQDFTERVKNSHSVENCPEVQETLNVNMRSTKFKSSKGFAFYVCPDHQVIDPRAQMFGMS